MRLLKILFWVVVLVAVTLAVARGAAYLRESDRLVNVLPQGGVQVATERGVMHSLSWGEPDKVPVLLIHGTGAWSGFWAETGTALADAGYHAVAVDMPPFGFSDRDPNGAYDRVSQAQRILAFARTLPKPPVLVAHSFGAAAGAEALVTNPQAFRGAVIVNGAVGLGKAPDAGGVPMPLRPKLVREAVVSATATNPLVTTILLRSLLHNKDAATPARVAILQQPMTLQGSTAAFADWLPSLLMPEGPVRSISTRAYAGLNLPVRVIWGAEDHITPVDQALALTVALAQEEPIILPGVGHIPQIEAPLAFQAALIDALGEITGQ